MKATPADQQELLRLQSIDTRIQQLAHRLGVLPQTAQLAELAKRETAVRGTRAEAIGTLEDAKTELARLESDVAVVEARIARDSDRLQHTSSVKDVQALEAELASLAKRRGDLEDQELVVMERVEEAEVVVSSIDLQRAAIESEVAELEAERDAAAGGITVEREQAERDREVVASGVPAELLAFYEQRRTRGAGVGAALLRQRTCGGCTMTLTGSDLESVRRSAPDDVVQCPECDRILVRTDESGL
ncbi:C4-type zinc ribbon domain-containing protein [Agromyces sp. H3Y2-19a]|uniref:zinc ribbon domain-containing protein n=1 Tax=Agromyces TaxID=33877 RepID=UPI001E5B03CA|nr:MULTISPECIES: C4-type zinc ribbon domain-containing protein [Agromyces]MCD5347246.1 C4-type zinc ribbon domain-containing protein [Agromyces sp. S2-1-8]MDF0513290.1 C4-type zinc ribbon domain-containing protein [Agromyces chromiiresistens]